MKRFDIIFYILLFLGLAIAASQFFAASARPTAQFVILTAIIAYYVLWGMAYHWLKKDLKRKLFLEYLTIGAIGVVVGVLIFLT